LAHPGNALPAKLRAKRIRVIRTIAHLLLLAEFVSSEGVAIRDAIVMALAVARGLGIERLFDLEDFITVAGSVFVTLGFNGVV